jgi:hypothetical protein
MTANSQQFQSAIFLSHEKIMDAMATISVSLHFILGNIYFWSEDFDNGLIYSFDIRVYLHFLKEHGKKTTKVTANATRLDGSQEMSLPYVQMFMCEARAETDFWSRTSASRQSGQAGGVLDCRAVQ